MVKIGDYSFSSYQGESSLDPEKSSDTYIGGNFPSGNFSMTTDNRTANVLQEVSTKLNMGVKNVEISYAISPEVFESIPKGQLREVNRLAKLTGTEMTLHAPVVEPSGIGKQGFDEAQRKSIERQMSLAIERAHELNPDGSAPVVFHASGAIPGTTWKPDKGKGKIHETLIAIDQETGQMAPLIEETMYYPISKEEIKEEYRDKLRALKDRGAKEAQISKWREERVPFTEKIDLEKGKVYSPTRRIEIMNDSKWDNEVSQVFFNQERANEILTRNAQKIQHILPEVQELISQGKDPEEYLQGEQKNVWRKYQTAENYLGDVHKQLNNTFHKAYKYGSEENKIKLKKLSEELGKELKKDPSILNQASAMEKFTIELNNLAPNLYVPIEQFAKEKSADTFSNVALKAWKEYKDKAPIISIENPPVGGAFASGEDLKELVEETRKKFVSKAVQEGVLSKWEAEKQAEKLIGVTWDIGHINMLRKQGFGKEEIIKQSGKVKPLVKHVHFSDNFGIEHTELPMGMGNVPTKEIMEKLGEEGFKAKKVIEAFHWWQHFKTPPFQSVMENVGSPMYSEGVGPYWNRDSNLQEGYFGGYGLMLPDTHFQTWGSGFSQLPMELGGQMPGGQGNRMSGRPME